MTKATRRVWRLALVVAAVAALAGAAGPLALRDDGVLFPDGSLQSTAAMGLAGAARSSFRWGCALVLEDGEASGYCKLEMDYGKSVVGGLVGTVPRDKIMVVETVSGQVISGASQGVAAELQSGPVSSGIYTRLELSLVALGGVRQPWDAAGDFELLTVGRPLRTYFYENEPVQIQVHRSAGTGGQLQARFVIQGYFVDAS